MPNSRGLPPVECCARDQAEPGGKLSSFAEGRTVANGCHGRSRHQRSYSGDLPQTLASRIFSCNRVDLITHTFHFFVSDFHSCQR